MDGEIGHEDLRSLLDEMDEGAGERDEGAGERDERSDESQCAERDVRIVDVREPSAFARGHVPGSENVPFGTLVEDVERFAGADRVVTICPHGKASVKAARLIAAYEGFDGHVESFAPGLSGWDGPLESAGATATSGDEADTADRSDEGPAAPF